MNDVCEWRGQNRYDTYKFIVDTTNPIEIVQWCKDYIRNKPDADTNDPLIRFNIGLYQLGYAMKMENDVKISLQLLDFGESIASAIIHMIIAVEQVLDTTDKFIIWDHIFDKAILREDNKFLECVCLATRQFVYYKMGRKNRMNYDDLIHYVYSAIRLLVARMQKQEVNIPEAFNVAMQKMQNIELKGH